MRKIIIVPLLILSITFTNMSCMKNWFQPHADSLVCQNFQRTINYNPDNTLLEQAKYYIIKNFEWYKFALYKPIKPSIFQKTKFSLSDIIYLARKYMSASEQLSFEKYLTDWLIDCYYLPYSKILNIESTFEAYNSHADNEELKQTVKEKLSNHDVFSVILLLVMYKTQCCEQPPLHPDWQYYFCQLPDWQQERCKQLYKNLIKEKKSLCTIF